MGRFYTDFSEYTTGQQPAGWVESGEQTQVSYTIISGAQYTGGKALQAVMSSTPLAPTPLIYSDGYASDVQEVLVKGTVTTFFGSSGRIIGCVVIWNFDDDNGNGYYGVLNSSQLQIWRTVGLSPIETVLATASAGFTPTAGNMYWVRFQVDASGDHPILRLKAWSASSEEPANWGLVHTDTAVGYVSDPGYAGVIGQSVSAGQNPTFDIFGYGWGGDPAPSEPVPSGEEAKVESPVIIATSYVLVPAVIVPKAAIVEAVLTNSDAFVLAPGIITSRPVDIQVPLVQASAGVLAPGVDARKIVLVTPGLVSAHVVALTPVVEVSRAAFVRPSVLESDANVLVPIATTGRRAQVTSPVVDAFAQAFPPVVSVEKHIVIAPEVVEAIASGLVPTIKVSGAASISAPVIDSLAYAPIPLVRASKSVFVMVPVVEVVAETLFPLVTTERITRVEATIIDVEAAVFVPDVLTSKQALILAPISGATTLVLAPSVILDITLPRRIVLKVSPSKSTAVFGTSGRASAVIKRGGRAVTEVMT